jgi:hypothetical protein
MSSIRTHINFSTFLNYHGTTNADPLLCSYVEAFDNFCKFQSDYFFQSANEAFIRWNLQYRQTPLQLTEIPTFPSQTMASNNTLPVVVSSTSTSTTTLVNENNTDHQIAQLTEEYLDDDIRHILKPMDTFPISPTSSSSSFPASISPPPELQCFPLLTDPVDLCNLMVPPSQPPPPPPPSAPLKPMGKDISAMIQHNEEKKTKKRTANVQPIPKPKRKRPGRPTSDETLTKIANELDSNDLSTQNLILLALDGSEKKKKTILTCSKETIELYNLKQFSCYDFLGEARKKALDTIKEQKTILEHILYIEKIVTQHVEEKKK